MPEGDTLRQAAHRVGEVLANEELIDFWARKLRGHRPRAGQRIGSVEARGKNLLIGFDNGLTLRTHLGMSGSWRTRPVDTHPAALQRDPRLSLRLSTRLGHALCYSAPVIETHVPDEEPAALRRLGPDLADVPPDVDAAVARARELADPGTMLCDLLLDQSVAAGIGNAIKSEALFVAGLSPFRSLGTLDDPGLARLYGTAARLLAQNSRPGAGPRASTIDGRLFVYNRLRQPCRCCTTPVERSYRGTSARSTYHCPRCQHNVQ
jgi:endonuclease-8